MINVCYNCKATREYPSGRTITKCPRCGSTLVGCKPSPKTQEERDDYLIRVIKGDSD